MGLIAELCLPKSLNSHIVLPVQKPDPGMLPAKIPGKFAVDGGICPVQILPCFFKMDIKGILRQRGGHGDGSGFSIHQKNAAFQAQGIIVLKGTGHGDILQKIIALRVFPDVAVEPSVHQPSGLIQRTAVQRDQLMIRVICTKAVKMVPFFLKFLAFQIRQIVNGIDIIKAVPVGAESN